MREVSGIADRFVVYANNHITRMKSSLLRRAAFLHRPHQYAVTVLPPLRVPRGGEAEAVRTWVASLEAIVRAHPTQWFNFFDVWRPFGP